LYKDLENQSKFDRVTAKFGIFLLHSVENKILEVCFVQYLFQSFSHINCDLMVLVLFYAITLVSVSIVVNFTALHSYDCCAWQRISW